MWNKVFPPQRCLLNLWRGTLNYSSHVGVDGSCGCSQILLVKSCGAVFPQEDDPLQSMFSFRVKMFTWEPAFSIPIPLTLAYFAQFFINSVNETDIDINILNCPLFIKHHQYQIAYCEISDPAVWVSMRQVHLYQKQDLKQRKALKSEQLWTGYFHSVND